MLWRNSGLLDICDASMKIKRVTLLGHKDHGKSTLIGNLLVSTGTATKERINEAKKISKSLRRQFEPAFILDSFSEEREGGLTIDTTRAQIKYKDLGFEFIDVPGHEELIKNMISGASHADFAVLIVSVKKDEGIKDQTKRHLFLAKIFGIKKIVIAVNKMDSVDYSEKIFNDVTRDIGEYLEKIGIDKKDYESIPISAYSSENLVKRSENMRWYKGKPLMEILYQMGTKQEKKASMNFRMLLQGESDGRYFGRVISGMAKVSDNMKILPIGREAAIKKIYVKGKNTKRCEDGENPAIEFDEKLGFDPRGMVALPASEKFSASKKLRALVFAMEPIGLESRVRFIGNQVDAVIKFLEEINTTDGERKKMYSKELEPLDAAEVELTLAEALPAEKFDESEELGRLLFYSGNSLSGVGIIEDTR